MNNNNTSNFVNANASNNNNNLTQFKGYNEYYEELRAAKGRNSKTNNNEPTSINLFNNAYNNNSASIASDPGPVNNEPSLTLMKPNLALMNNNATATMTKNSIIQSILSDTSIPMERKLTMQQIIKSLPTGEYERLSREYHGMSNNNIKKPAQFVTFLMERVKQKGGKRRSRSRKSRKQKRRRTNRK